MIDISDPYISEEDANTLEDQSLPVTIRVVQESDDGVYEHNDIDVWSQADDDDYIEAALKDATRYIDNFEYIGEKKEDDQELKFPRDFQEDVPDEVKIATQRIAREMLRQHYIHNGFPTLMIQPIQIQATDFYSQTAQSQTSIKTEVDWDRKIYDIFRRYMGKYLRKSYPILSMDAIYERPSLTSDSSWSPGDGNPNRWN